METINNDDSFTTQSQYYSNSIFLDSDILYKKYKRNKNTKKIQIEFSNENLILHFPNFIEEDYAIKKDDNLKYFEEVTQILKDKSNSIPIIEINKPADQKVSDAIDFIPFLKDEEWMSKVELETQIEILDFLQELNLNSFGIKVIENIKSKLPTEYKSLINSNNSLGKDEDYTFYEEILSLLADNSSYLVFQKLIISYLKLTDLKKANISNNTIKFNILDKLEEVIIYFLGFIKNREESRFVVSMIKKILFKEIKGKYLKFKTHCFLTFLNVIFNKIIENLDLTLNERLDCSIYMTTDKRGDVNNLINEDNVNKIEPLYLVSSWNNDVNTIEFKYENTLNHCNDNIEKELILNESIQNPSEVNTIPDSNAQPQTTETEKNQLPTSETEKTQLQSRIDAIIVELEKQSQNNSIFNDLIKRMNLISTDFKQYQNYTSNMKDDNKQIINLKEYYYISLNKYLETKTSLEISSLVKNKDEELILKFFLKPSENSFKVIIKYLSLLDLEALTDTKSLRKLFDTEKAKNEENENLIKTLNSHLKANIDLLSILEKENRLLKLDCEIYKFNMKINNIVISNDINNNSSVLSVSNMSTSQKVEFISNLVETLNISELNTELLAKLNKINSIEAIKNLDITNPA